MKLKVAILSLAMMVMAAGMVPATGFAQEAANAQQGTTVVNENGGQDQKTENGETEKTTETTTNSGAAPENEPVIVDKAPEEVNAADARGYDSIKLSWDAVDGVEEYEIYMAESEDGEYTRIATTTDTSYTVKDLKTGEMKYFRVSSAVTGEQVAAAKNISAADLQLETDSDVVSAKPMVDKTSARSYLKTGTKARVKWNKISGASGYMVYIKNGKSWTGLRNVRSGKTLKVTRGGLKKKSTQTFKVVPYRTVDGRKAKGKATYSSVYVPKVLKKSTKTYKYTYQAQILKTARKKLGCPYVLGAEGPYRFDCSGFTYWTMRHAGVSGVKITRYSAQGIYNHYKKYSIGRSLSKAQPGDILLYGYGRSKHRIFHVGIYYGDGRYIHATTGGRGVTITKVPGSLVVSILRLKGLK
ncbi:MAG: NlpC/P60 family protein [Anaerovoracaceae bacterium]|jgi:cell wall-associated NlpC family hydrolase